MKTDPVERSTEEEGRRRRSMLRSAKAVGGITLASRVAGLARDFIQAHFLGTGAVADAFRVALLIPSLLRRLVGEGAMQSGFVPVFSRHVREGETRDLRIFAEKFITLWTAILLLVTGGGIVIATALLAAVLPGFAGWSGEHVGLTISLTRWLFLYLVVIGLSAVAQGVLNSFKIFALPAATPLLYNFGFIAAGTALYLLAGDDEVGAAWAFAAAVLGGGVLQFAILVPSLWRLGIRFRPRWPFDHAGVREVMRLLVPTTFGAGIYQINAFVATLIATSVLTGAPSSLYFSGRLMEVVLGVYVFALSTVSLTTLSQQAAAGDEAGFRRTNTEVLRLVGFITIPSTVGLLVLGRPIIELILESGRFGERSVELTLAAFVCHIPGLFFVGTTRILTSAFYAFKDVWTPVKIAGINLVLNAVLSYALAQTALRHAGIALAATICAVLQSALLFLGFQRRRRLVLAGDLARSIGRSIVAAAVMGAVCLAGLRLRPAGGGKMALGLFVAAEIAAGAAVFFATARLLGAPEVSALLGRWRRGPR